MLMVKAGPAVDRIIETLIPLLHSGDVIIDGGNTNSDTGRTDKSKQPDSFTLAQVFGEEGAAPRPESHARRLSSSMATDQTDFSINFSPCWTKPRCALLVGWATKRRALC